MKGRAWRRRQWALQTVVFFCGASTLAVEVLALRAMTPAFGNSIFIWGAVLSLTLICLALGYEWGGRLGDRLTAADETGEEGRRAAPGLASRPWARLVLHGILAAGWLAGLPLWDRWLLNLGLAAGPYFGPAVIALGLFAVPMVLLATVVPLAFRTSLGHEESRAGATLGRLFAVSTAGSVAGALVTAYLALPWLGVSRSLLAVAAVLFSVLLPWLWRGIHRDVTVILLFFLVVGRLLPGGLGGVELHQGVSFLHREASRYGQVDVVEDKRDGSRFLVLEGTVQNHAYGPGWLGTTFRYSRPILRLAEGHRTGPSARALVIGLGAGTLVRQLAREGWRVDVVEIDPALLEVARRWFAYPLDEIPVTVADGRFFLHQQVRRGVGYDLIVLDAYAGGTPPEHLYTREAFDLFREALTPRGLFVANLNVYTEPGWDRVLQHILATAREAFPRSVGLDMNARSHREGQLSQVLLLGARRLQGPEWTAVPGQRLLHGDPRLSPLTDARNPLPLWTVRAGIQSHVDAGRWLGKAVLVPH